MRSFVWSSWLLSDLWSLKCQKWLIFCIFCWLQQNISHKLYKTFNCIWKILFRSLRKFHGLLSSQDFSKMPTLENTEFRNCCIGSVDFFIFLPLTSHQSLLHSLLTILFLGKTQLDLSGGLKYFSQSVNIFLLSLSEHTIVSRFDILRTITPWRN